MMNMRLLMVLWTTFVVVVGAPNAFGDNARVSTSITVYLGERKLRIPKEYIGNGVDSEHLSAIWLPLFLPNLTSAQTNLSLFNRNGWNNKLTVMFEANHQFRSRQEVADLMLSFSKIDKSKYTELPNKCRRYTGEMITARVLYLCYLPDHLLLVECGGKQDSEFPSCSVFENLDNKTAVTYHYGIEHEGEIIQIDDKIRKLYKSFSDAQ